MSKRLGAVSMLAALCLGAQAQAATTVDWAFSFVLSNNDTGSGIFVTEPTGSGSYLITNILNGQLVGNGTDPSGPITYLAPGAGGPASQVFNDNLLFPGANPPLDGEGVGFVADGWQWALWSAPSGPGGGMQVSWCNNAVGGADHYCRWGGEPTSPQDPHGLVITGSLQEIPEPATWAMMLIGFGGLGAGLRMRRKQAARA
jgi:hypothetical protein